MQVKIDLRADGRREQHLLRGQNDLRPVAALHMDDDLKARACSKIAAQRAELFHVFKCVLSGQSAYQLIQHRADAECIFGVFSSESRPGGG